MADIEKLPLSSLDILQAWLNFEPSGEYGKIAARVI